MLARIISGGEPGTEQAALDAALASGVAHGGWIPMGRTTEAGTLPDEYLLSELSSADPETAAASNVEEADGTVLFFFGPRNPRCSRVAELASKHRKPCLEVDLEGSDPAAAAQALSIWLRMHGISVLHVTGPRASEEFRAYARVRAVMSLLLGSHRSSQSPVFRTAALRSGPGC